MKQIGNLFILRININLVGSILDSPVSDTSTSPVGRWPTSLAGLCRSQVIYRGSQLICRNSSGHIPIWNRCTTLRDHISRYHNVLIS